MNLKGILLSFLLIFISCNDKVVSNEFSTDFKNNRWLFNEKKAFSFSIENEQIADLILHLGHIYDFQFASIPLQIAISYPDGHTEIMSIDLMIKNNQGKDIADCSGDICDLYYTFKNQETLEKGNYLVVITNKFSGVYLPNILGVGIQVKK